MLTTNHDGKYKIAASPLVFLFAGSWKILLNSLVCRLHKTLMTVVKTLKDKKQLNINILSK